MYLVLVSCKSCIFLKWNYNDLFVWYILYVVVFLDIGDVYKIYLWDNGKKYVIVIVFFFLISYEGIRDMKFLVRGNLLWIVTVM